MQYPSFSKRLFATIIDLVVMNVGIMIVGELFLDTAKLQEIVAQAESGMLDAPSMQMLMHAALVLSIASLAVVVLVDAILPATAMMGTPGKHILGLASVDMNGRRLSLGTSIGRHAAKFVSMITIIGLFMPLVSKNKQALHDKMCGTLVVKKKSLATKN